MPKGSDLIEYRWLNMDNKCRTTEKGLYEYARKFPNGHHRVICPMLWLEGEPVLRAYGCGRYSYDDMVSLNCRLPVNGSAAK